MYRYSVFVYGRKFDGSDCVACVLYSDGCKRLEPLETSIR